LDSPAFLKLKKQMEEFKKEIDKVLSGEIEGVQSKTLIAPADVDEYLRSVGLKEETMDSVGWERWLHYSIGLREFTMSYDGWHNKGITFSVRMKKTSEEWFKRRKNLIIHRYDGWDTRDFRYSWHEELITEEEFHERLCYSLFEEN
jgi:hypothetical protein